MVPSRLVRTALFASFVLALLALARPASASSAPFCDDRGASAIALPPALDAPDEAIARSRACTGAGDELSPFTAVVRTRLSMQRGFDGLATALPRTGVVVRHFPGVTMNRAPPMRLGVGGVTSRVERPPRS
jgi:hypothetical protein